MQQNCEQYARELCYRRLTDEAMGRESLTKRVEDDRFTLFIRLCDLSQQAAQLVTSPLTSPPVLHDAASWTCRHLKYSSSSSSSSNI